MYPLTVLPNITIAVSAPVSEKFLSVGIHHFIDACRFVHELPYGYNSNRDDLMILFKENFGSCTTKHAVIATLAAELGMPINKAIGIYAMTEEIVSGTSKLLDKYGLPYVPMLHCFLVHGEHRIDLTVGLNPCGNLSCRFYYVALDVPPPRHPFNTDSSLTDN